MTGEQEKDSRYIQGSWVPYALLAVCLDISSAEAQLGQVYATLPPLAALHQINPKAATSELRKPNKNSMDEGPIWPAGKSRDAGNSPET